MNIEYFIMPAVGGVIGYFTNWLAIKMLFLPRSEKRLFGVRVPLTPGVLPKSKERLAAKVGETVGNYLLTEETIKAAILSADMNATLEGLMDHIYQRARNTDKSLGEAMDILFGNDTGEAVDKLKAYVRGTIEELVRDEEKRNHLSHYLCDILFETVNNIDIQLYSNKVFEYVTDIVEEKGALYLETEEFRQLLDNFCVRIMERLMAEDRPLSAFISPETVHSLKLLILSKMPEIAMVFQKTLLENHTLNTKLMELTKKVVDESVGHFLGGLVYKKVYESIKDSAVSYISNTENMIAFSEQISGYLDMALEKSVNYYLCSVQNIHPIDGESLGKNLYNLLKTSDLNNSAKNILDYLHQKTNEVLKDRSLCEIMLIINPNLEIN